MRECRTDLLFGAVMLPRSIGVTDVPTGAAASALADVIPADANFCLHVGVMMNRKTLLGLPTRWSAIWPRNVEIAEIFTAHPRVLNVLHYADYNASGLTPPLAAALCFAGPHLHAVQLDMIWPDVRALVRFRARYPFLESVILQIGLPALKMCGGDWRAACRAVAAYGAAIDGILIDMSMGLGVLLDPIRTDECVAIARAELPDLRIAIAGGLGSETVSLIEPILAKYPGISIDAAGRLRPSGNSSKEKLSLPMAEAYVRAASALFVRYP